MRKLKCGVAKSQMRENISIIYVKDKYGASIYRDIATTDLSGLLPMQLDSIYSELVKEWHKKYITDMKEDIKSRMVRIDSDGNIKKSLSSILTFWRKS